MLKISEDFAIREILDEYVVVPVKGSGDNNTGLISVNESGKIIMKGIISGKSFDEIVSEICDEYEIDEKIAADDVNEFIVSFKSLGVITE